MGIPNGGGQDGALAPPGTMLFPRQLLKFPIRNKLLKKGIPMYSDKKILPLPP